MLERAFSAARLVIGGPGSHAGGGSAWTGGGSVSGRTATSAPAGASVASAEITARALPAAMAEKLEVP
jgi:hypothetical protein